MPISQFYYINLNRRKDRLKHMSKEISKSKILKNSIVRYSGVDGRELDLCSVSQSILKNNSFETVRSKKVRSYGVSLTYGSLACAISHYNLFNLCYQNNNGNILILEDDVLISSDIDLYLEKINSCNLYYDIFYLGIHRSKHSKIIKTENENIFNLRGIFWGGFAYVLTPRACEFIIKNIFPIDQQFDSAIYNKINKNDLTAMYFGHNVIKSGHFLSDNQGKNGLINNSQDNSDVWNDLFI
jgi:GR25 family glycosyltransferase involved in LPS biosynthesis